MTVSNKKKTILVAMSGGVDSSVAALLLKKQGYNVIGAFMKNFSDTKNPITGECSYIEDQKMARKISAILDIPLITLDSEKEFKKQVINYMFKSYSNNLTPNPDILCNKTIKFPLLWKEAKRLKINYIATGHYAKIKKTKSGFQLYEGKDKAKDQSYFLSQLAQNDLSRTLFPLGNMKKTKVRKIAKKNNLPNYNKKSTTGICFVGKVNIKSFLEKKIKNKKGKILDINNNIIGYHPGIMYSTIGQRVGSRLGFQITKKINEKLYVAEKKKPNTMIIAPKNHPLLKRQIIKIKAVHLINPKEKISKNLKARIRHLGNLYQGKLIKKNKSYYFKFTRPIEAIAEGQFIVLHDKDKIIGGGEIRYLL